LYERPGSSQVHDATDEKPLDIESAFRRRRGDLERWAARLGGPLVDAEDVAQEVMMVAHAKLPEFHHEAQLTTWLFKTTQTLRPRTGVANDAAAGCAACRSTTQPSSKRAEPSVLEEMERREAAAEVYSALDRLAEKYRSVVILFEIEGLSGDEIASLTGLSLATVWVHLHRGRKKLRAHYRELVEKRGER
jgi:RNA polymerase sigma-70 factor (ECF subfamily)